MVWPPPEVATPMGPILTSSTSSTRSVSELADFTVCLLLGLYLAKTLDPESNSSMKRRTTMKKILAAGIIVMGIVAGLGASFTRLVAQQRGAATGSEAAVTIDADDVGGVVRSARGPEAGVWVMDETKR